MIAYEVFHGFLCKEQICNGKAENEWMIRRWQCFMLVIFFFIPDWLWNIKFFLRMILMKHKADFPHLQVQSLRCLIERYPLWTVPDVFYAVNTTVKFILLWKKSFPRWIVPVWKADAANPCDCLCLSRSEISFCLCFKVYISVLYRSSFFHRSVFLQKKRCEALSAFFYFISFPLPL